MGGEHPAITVRRSIPAEPGEVFAAWTDPALLRRWLRMGADWTTPVAEADPRPRGRYVVEMRTPAGNTVRYEGRYLDLEPGRRIDMSWPAYGRAELQTALRIELSSRTRGTTTITLTQTGLVDQDARDDHAAGWAAVLGQLEAAATAGLLRESGRGCVD